MKFFTCSVGKPNADYVEDNLRRIIDNKGFVLHNDTLQKGTFNDIETNDILLLRYNKMFIAYGRVSKIEISDDEEWNHWAFVEEWNFYNDKNPKTGIDRYGVDDNTIGGGKYGTVKTISNNFGFEKITEINNSSLLYKSIYRIMKKKMNENIGETLELLKYKKQIILQGPPGTGKTRLAKEIANDLMNDNPQNLSPKELIENFFKLGKSDKVYNENFKNRLEEFYDYFPKNQFSKMELDDYCIGKSNNTNFCWWIEKGLDKYGKFTPGNAGNYVIYYSKGDEDYRLTKFSDQGIFDTLVDIQNALSDLSEKEDVTEASKLFGDSFIIKILNSYYPEKYFPINGRTSLVNLMKIFEMPFKKIATIELNKNVQNIFNEYKNIYPSDVTTLDFMHFLYSKFDLKKDGNLYEDSNEIDVSRKPSLIQFHPSYTYEDFVRGIVATPNDKGEGIIYKAEDRLLIKLANEAKDNNDNNYVLIIDEINRANLSSVLGELIYALEYRGEEVDSVYEINNEGNKIILPPNLYIIGTMNTADRSVGHIDYAIRRRFAFVDVLPKQLKEDDEIYFNTSDFSKVSALFNEINVSKEFEIDAVQIGHSYFIVKKDEAKDEAKRDKLFKMKMDYEVKPILLEYERDGILIGKYEEMPIKDYIKSL